MPYIHSDSSPSNTEHMTEDQNLNRDIGQFLLHIFEILLEIELKDEVKPLPVYTTMDIYVGLSLFFTYSVCFFVFAPDGYTDFFINSFLSLLELHKNYGEFMIYHDFSEHLNLHYQIKNHAYDSFNCKNNQTHLYPVIQNKSSIFKS